MGFPWHPHRGIETVTYLLKGTVEHEDSMGNKGTIGPGDVQWMTAGSGIFHSEMPRPLGQKGVPSNNLSSSEVRGLQLWINVPASEKMNDPEYQNLVGKAVPSAELDDGAFVKAVAGALGSVSDLGLLQGPVQDNGVDAGYFDVTIPAGGRLDLKVKEGYTAGRLRRRGRDKRPILFQTGRAKIGLPFQQVGRCCKHKSRERAYEVYRADWKAFERARGMVWPNSHERRGAASAGVQRAKRGYLREKSCPLEGLGLMAWAYL